MGENPSTLMWHVLRTKHRPTHSREFYNSFVSEAGCGLRGAVTARQRRL